MFQLKTTVRLHKAEENKKMGDVMKQEQEIGAVMCIWVSKDERAQDALDKCGTLPSSTHENNIDGTAAGQLPAIIYGAFRQCLSDLHSESCEKGHVWRLRQGASRGVLRSVT
jgi:hypothetical protein